MEETTNLFSKIVYHQQYKEIEAVIHSIRIAHSDWIGPAELNLHDAEFRLN